jgi:CRP/FNR family transcriptional regulator, dissimilatory nitrate respiration regulator
MDEAIWRDLARQTGLHEEDRPIVTSLLLFERLDLATIARLLRGARVTRVERGVTLFAQGDPADRLFAVLEGWVKLARETSSGHESVIGVLGRGESFAEAAALQGGRFPVDAVVVERARLLVIPAQRFLGHLREQPEIAFNILAAMSRHLRSLVQQIEQLSTRTTVERVAGFLLTLAEPGAAQADLPLPLDKALIAGRLGMRPETFSRALARLRAEGVDEVDGVIKVTDLPRLRRLARGEITP